MQFLKGFKIFNMFNIIHVIFKKFNIFWCESQTIFEKLRYAFCLSFFMAFETTIRK